MLKLRTCWRGHHWEAVDEDGDSSGRASVCPVCGAAPDDLPLLDLAATDVPEPAVAAPPSPAPPPPLRDTAGRPILSGYEILEDLGRGPTGVRVFKAKQLLVNRTVLLKVVEAKEDPGQTAWGSLRGEAAALGRLSHANIVQVHDAGERDRQLFFNAVEFVNGPTLAQKCGGKPLPPRQAALLVETLARAIHYAHQQGVVHRCLKPGCVLLEERISRRGAEAAEERPGAGGWSGDHAPARDHAPGPGAASSSFSAPLREMPWTLKITDFGLARRPVEGEATDVELQAGPPCYLAPEQAWGRVKEIGPASDVYALGAILFELLAGRPPFLGKSVPETLEKIQFKEIVAPSTYLARVPADLDAVCLKCLQKQPRHRYSSALELAEDLRRFATGLPVKVRPLGILARSVRWARRRPSVAVLMLVILLAGVACLTISRVGDRRDVENRRQILSLQNQEHRARERAEEAAVAARAAERREEQTAYFHRVLLADRESLARRNNRARQLLEDCPPGPRHWEWNYLNHRLQDRGTITLRGANLPLAGLAFSPDGQTVMAFGGEGRQPGAPNPEGKGEVAFWDVKTGQKIRSFDDFSGPVRQAAYSPNGTRFAVASGLFVRGGELRILGADGKTLAKRPSPAVGLAYAPDGGRLAVVAEDGRVTLPDGTTGADVNSRFFLAGRPSPRVSLAPRVAFRGDGAWLVSTAPNDHEVRVWDTRTSQLLFQLHGHTAEVLALVSQPGGGQFASAGRDQTIQLWDPETSGSGPRTTLKGHGAAVTGLAYSPDGKRLASSSADGAVKIWDPATGTEVLTIGGFAGGAAGVAFSPDGHRLAIAHGKEVMVLEGSPN